MIKKDDGKEIGKLFGEALVDLMLTWDKDLMIYGDAYVEFTPRKIEIHCPDTMIYDPKKKIFKQKKVKKQ